MGRGCGVLGTVLALLVSSTLLADVSLLSVNGFRDRKAAKKSAKAKKTRFSPTVAGGLSLIDQSGLEYFINTNIAFATSSSASGAALDATFAAPVNASTASGGTTAMALSDMFDGYGGLCYSTNGTTGPCNTGNPSFTFYNQTGAAPTPECGGRQYVFPAQTKNGITVQRKVHVPTDDSFIRWMNVFTNTTGAPVTITATDSNNLGSDIKTTIVATSSGNAVPGIADKWITSFQNWSGTTSTDPRIAHVVWSGSPALGPMAMHFVDGDESPWWSFQLTLQPGQTRILLRFASGHGTKAAAAAQAVRLVSSPMPPTARACMTPLEKFETSNFILPGAQFLAMAPCRLYDTRNASGPDMASPALGANESRIFTIGGRCGVPSTAKSLSINVTVTGPTAQGSLNLFRGDLPSAPNTSSITFPPGLTRANNGILELARDGSGTFKAFNSSTGTVDFILDVNGYFQ